MHLQHATGRCDCSSCTALAGPDSLKDLPAACCCCTSAATRTCTTRKCISHGITCYYCICSLVWNPSKLSKQQAGGRAGGRAGRQAGGRGRLSGGTAQTAGQALAAVSTGTHTYMSGLLRVCPGSGSRAAGVCTISFSHGRSPASMPGNNEGEGTQSGVEGLLCQGVCSPAYKSLRVSRSSTSTASPSQHQSPAACCPELHCCAA